MGQHISFSESETFLIARQLGTSLRRGDIICLCGDLGAGKTVFAKGLASFFGIDEREVKSPSFTIIAQYEAKIPFYHIDLYRLSTIEEIEHTGIYDCLNDNGITVIEWAERLCGLIDCNIRVDIEYGNDGVRYITIDEADRANRKD